MSESNKMIAKAWKWVKAKPTPSPSKQVTKELDKIIGQMEQLQAQHQYNPYLAQLEQRQRTQKEIRREQEQQRAVTPEPFWVKFKGGI